MLSGLQVAHFVYESTRLEHRNSILACIRGEANKQRLPRNSDISHTIQVQKLGARNRLWHCCAKKYSFMMCRMKTPQWRQEAQHKPQQQIATLRANKLLQLQKHPAKYMQLVVASATHPTFHLCAKEALQPSTSHTNIAILRRNVLLGMRHAQLPVAFLRAQLALRCAHRRRKRKCCC